MRDPNRIDKFILELGKMWKKECPDWRFGQLINNLQRAARSDLFYLEEDEFLELMTEFFKEFHH